MSCRSCREMEDLDGLAPACEAGQCVVPPLGPSEARVVELRSRALALRSIMEPAEVLSALRATERDLLILSEVEAGLREMQREGTSEREEGGHGV